MVSQHVGFLVGCLDPVEEGGGEGGREGEREREISAMAFPNVITGEIFEMICT